MPLALNINHESLENIIIANEEIKRRGRRRIRIGKKEKEKDKKNN